jgi:hypothetical protein
MNRCRFISNLPREDFLLERATESATDFESANIRVLATFTWEMGICTVSSIGRASDS